MIMMLKKHESIEKPASELENRKDTIPIAQNIEEFLLDIAKME